MQVSTSTQYTQINLPKELSSPKVSKDIDINIDTNSTNDTFKYNETSKFYFELSEDISKYQISPEEQEKQNKIDEDVSNIVKKYTSNDKGYSMFRADLNLDYTTFRKDFYNDEFVKYWNEQTKILQNLRKNGAEVTQKLLDDNPIIQSYRKKQKELFKDGLSIDFKYYSIKDIEENAKNSFKNIYHLSNNISSEEFNTIYTEYREIIKEKELEAKKAGKDLMHYLYQNADAGTLEKDFIIQNSKSKTEWLDHFDRYKTILEGYLEEYNTNKNIELGPAGIHIPNDLKENIKYFDNIIKDLKDLWGYGDLDLKV